MIIMNVTVFQFEYIHPSEHKRKMNSPVTSTGTKPKGT